MHILAKPENQRTPGETSRVQGYKLAKNILYVYEAGDRKRDLFVVPQSMRKLILFKSHNLAGHFGKDRTVEHIRRSCWFPEMRSYAKYIKECIECLFRKHPAGKRHGMLNPIPPGKRPFEIVHMDHLGPFVRSSRRSTVVLVLVDNLPKYVQLRSYASTETKYVLRFLD